MPKAAAELGPLDIKRLNTDGKYAVGGVAGLYFTIEPGGSKYWSLRVVVGKKRREIGLGGYPTVTLAKARERAREARDLIRQGVDPVEQKKALRAQLIAAQRRGLTFAEAFERFAADKLGTLATDRDRVRWRSSIERYAMPAIGDMLVDDLTVQDMQRVLQPIWLDKFDTAKKLRSRLEAILSWATVAGHRTGDNPARWKGNLDALMPKVGKAQAGNQPAVALKEAPAWFADLRQRVGMGARALEFATLCASRSGEVRGAVWSEIDFDRRLWIIPASRMKAAAEHRVPLSDASFELLETLPRMQGTGFVFPAVRGGQLSDMTLSAVMRRQHEAEVAAGRSGWLDTRSGKPAVPHGLRSTFKDWAVELTQFPNEMSEVALAHQVGSAVERSYRRSDMVERRRAMMQEWSDFLNGRTAEAHK
jgi:integrase